MATFTGWATALNTVTTTTGTSGTISPIGEFPGTFCSVYDHGTTSLAVITPGNPLAVNPDGSFTFTGGASSYDLIFSLSASSSAAAVAAVTATFPDPVTVAHGGTGLTAYAIGDLLTASTVTALSALPDVATGSVLVSGGVGVVPAWSATPTLTSLTLGSALTPANGGTGLASYAIGDLVTASGATTLSKVADVATGSVLVSGGVGVVPAWSASPTLTSLTLGSALAPASGGTGLASYTTGDLLTASGATTLAKVADVATGSVLVSGGVGVVPAWSANPSLTTVLVGDGTQLLPAIAFASEATLGFYRSASGTMRLQGLSSFTLSASAVSAVSLTNPSNATLQIGGDLTLTAGLAIGSGSFVGWASRSLIGAPANGQINLTTNAGSIGVGLDVATDATVKVRTRAQSAYASVDALGYATSGVAGVATFGPAAVASITVKGGIITAIS